jgi:hypothetical protein
MPFDEEPRIRWARGSLALSWTFYSVPPARLWRSRPASATSPSSLACRYGWRSLSSTISVALPGPPA